MMEGLGSAPDPRHEPETVESTALAGAAAIQRIISERDSLRNVTNSQQSEIAHLRSANNDLRRRLLMIRQHYLELATEILAHFEKFDGALREALQDPPPDASGSDDDRLVDLAQRLAPSWSTRGEPGHTI